MSEKDTRPECVPRWTRRETLRVLGAAGAWAACPAPLRAAGGAAKGARNLLIVQTDEQSFRTLGCYRATLPPELAFVWGPEAFVETPHADALAASGAICTRFYATSPVCSASRASFVSGRYPHQVGVQRNNERMHDGVVTFAQVLRDAGYATGYAGKWHLDGPAIPGWAPERRFGFDDNRFMFNRGHWKLLEDAPSGPRVGHADGKPAYHVIGDAESYTTDFLTDRTLEFVAAHQERPFCFMVSFPDPHKPYLVRSPYDTMFAGMQFSLPATHREPAQGRPAWAQAAPVDLGKMGVYFGMVRCIDDNLGRIVAGLRELGLLERTVVVFTSDHGSLLGEHHRMKKGVPFEAAARIPMLVAAPGRIAPGTVVPQVLDGTDFAPTILGLLGVGAHGMPGRDASRALTGGDMPEGSEVSVVSHAKNRWVACVSARHKLVVSADDGPWLFDHERDPDELVNFVSDPAARSSVRALAAVLAAHAQTTSEPLLSQPKLAGDVEALLAG